MPLDQLLTDTIAIFLNKLHDPPLIGYNTENYQKQFYFKQLLYTPHKQILLQHEAHCFPEEVSFPAKIKRKITLLERAVKGSLMGEQ